MSMVRCRLIGFSSEDKQKTIAERNKKIANLVLLGGMPHAAVASRFGVSKYTVSQAVTAARREGWAQ